MNRSDTHLSIEALAAYVDGELAAGPRLRAAEHVAQCLECGVAVGIQQQSKESLSQSSGTFSVPASLMARLGGIPFEAPLDNVTASSVGGQPVFQFAVNAPAGDQPASGPTPTLTPRRSRFTRGAALVAVGVGLSLSPTLLGGNSHLQDGAGSHLQPPQFGTVAPGLQDEQR